MPVLQLHEVGYVIERGNSSGVRILESISLSVDKGGALTILGPSGSGKSTVLRICNRLLEPSEGRILFHDKPVDEYPVAQLRRRIGLVFQTPVLFKGLNLRDNLLFALRCQRKPSEEDNQIAEQLLSKVGLSPEILTRSYNEISVGQAQRLCLARTLSTQPEVLLLDEPTASLDPSSKQEIERLIRSLQQERGLTILFVTHDLEQARRLGGAATVLVGGKSVESGQVEDILDRPQNELTSKFVSGNLQGG